MRKAGAEKRRHDNPVRLAVVGLRGVSDVIGGIETHCKTLYPPLADRAPDLAVTLLVRKRYSRNTPTHLGRLMIKALPAPKGQGVEAFTHSILGLFYAWLRLRADIIHFHGIGPGILSPLARFMGMRVVVTHHAADFRRPKWGPFSRTVLRAGEFCIARYAHRIVCVSAALKAEFLARHPVAISRTTTIRHGVALEKVAADSDILLTSGLKNGAYLLAVGRLERTKRYEDLILAHGQARPGALPLVIVGAEVGGTSYEESLRHMAGKQIHFLGAQNGAALAALYQGAARFIHPSHMEGFGLVVLEALSAGVPVTLSDIAVHREFDLPSDSYVQVGDVKTLSEVISTTGERERPWPAAQSVVAQHSQMDVIDAYIDLFRSLSPVGERAAGPARNMSNNAQ